MSRKEEAKSGGASEKYLLTRQRQLFTFFPTFKEG